MLTDTKNFGLIAISLFWLLVVFMIVRAKHSHGASISEHIAKSRTSMLIFGMGQLLVMVLFGIFLLDWFVPHFQLGGAYVAVILLGISSTVLAAVAPATKGLARKIHDGAAYIMAVTLIISLALIAISNNVTMVAQAITAACVIAMVVLSVTFALSRKRHGQKLKLRLQIGYYLLFQISILATTYIT